MFASKIKTSLKRVLIFAILIFAACTHKPTKVGERTGNTVGPIDQAKGERDVIIAPDTVVLDVREPFAFATSHLRGAHWIDHKVFRNEHSRFLGALPADLSEVTRRISRLGISKQTPVVVIGYGPNGHGEEGRVAWLLHYAGVENVHFATQEYFQAKLTASPTSERESQPWWDPTPQTTEVVSPGDIKGIAKQPHRLTQIRIVDVRPARDYLGQEGFGKTRKVPEIGAINIPWTEMIDPYGRPNPAIVERLSAVGIQRSENLLLLSAQGYESATALMVLRELGFTNITHVPAGFEEILTTWSKK